MVTTLICNGLIFLHNFLLGTLHRKGKNSIAVEIWRLPESEQGDWSRQERKIIKLKSGKRGGFLFLLVCLLVFVVFFLWDWSGRGLTGTQKENHVTSDRFLRMKLSWNHKLILTYFFVCVNILCENTMAFSLYATFKNIYCFYLKKNITLDLFPT